MIFADIVALAKAGYGPKDVKDLLELCETDPNVKAKEPKKEPETEPKKEPEKDPEDPDKEVKNAFEKLIEKET